MPEVVYRSKAEMDPRFGFAIPELQKVYVRGDLPACVRQFVVMHECYHLSDDTSWWVWRELKANMHAAIRFPIGFMGCLLMSTAPRRLCYYFKRMIGRQQ